MKKGVIAIILCSICLSGCASAQKESKASAVDSTETVQGALQDFPETYEKEDGNVSFACEVTAGTDAGEPELYTATAKLRKIDFDAAFDKLYSDISEYETYEYEEENECGDKVKTATYVDKDETSFSYGSISSRISYLRMTIWPYLSFQLDETADDYNAELFSTEKELGFSDREEVFHSMMQLFEEIDAGNDYKYKAYALDHATLEAEEVHEDMDGNRDSASYKDSWSEEDDCYYFVVRQYYENLPVYHVLDGVFVEESDMNAPVQAVVSAEGIEYLDVERVFDFENKKQVEQIASFDKVAQTVCEKYNQILGEASYQIDTAELYYYVDISSDSGVYEVKPCWILKGFQKADNAQSRIQTIVDAQTGEEIVP